MVVGDIAGGGGVGGLLLVVLENIGLLVVVVGDIAGGDRGGGCGGLKGPCICCSTAHKPQSSPRRGYFSFFFEKLVLFSSVVFPLQNPYDRRNDDNLQIEDNLMTKENLK